MKNTSLVERLQPRTTAEKDGIHIAKEIAERTVWDKLAIENPTHAVISAQDEEKAHRKSLEQLECIKPHLNPSDVLLDCGTGYGRVAKYLLPDMQLAGYIGVDSSYEMLKLFKAHYDASEAEQRTPLLLLNADIHTLPLLDKSVDVALVSAVFLHNHKSVVQKAMMEIFRVIKPGGTMLVYSSFPRGMTLMGMQGYLYQMLLNVLGKPLTNGPVRYYRKREIAHLFADFAELDVIPVGFAVLPKTLIFLPKPLEKIWRVGLANPFNSLLERIMPTSFKPYFATHYDVVAKR